eukprot:GHVP01067179.1.p1 GENE.GHVP01067179.1~~GHVP01067179.1.p1  ORF type:complete len:106 (+),score=16.37 GHVP01067179.1:706-1023(+)
MRKNQNDTDALANINKAYDTVKNKKLSEEAQALKAVAGPPSDAIALPPPSDAIALPPPSDAIALQPSADDIALRVPGIDLPMSQAEADAMAKVLISKQPLPYNRI